MGYQINVGDAIPTFRAMDQEGEVITDEDLLGTPAVLYFYPKDDTPGCTKEACSFRDNIRRLSDYDVILLGISPDSASSHQKFIEKQHLNFSLICDEKLELCKKFGVIKEMDVKGEKKIGVERSTFYIDRDGIIQWIERPVNIEGHVDRVIEVAKKFSK